MLRLRCLALIFVSVAVTGCQESPPAAIDTTTVTLPDNFAVRAELKVTPADMARGMMYRDSVADGEGMLFVHQSPGLNPYWMGHCKFPLDIIWMDSKHKVV